MGIGGGANGTVRGETGVVVEDWGPVGVVTIDGGASCTVIGQILVDFCRNLIVFGAVDTSGEERVSVFILALVGSGGSPLPSPSEGLAMVSFESTNKST